MDYRTFIESICAMYGHPDMASPLTEGFNAFCESYTEDIGIVASRVKGGDEPNFTHLGYKLNQWLVHYSPYASRVARDGFKYARFPTDDMMTSLDTDEESPEYHKNVGIDGNLIFAFPLKDELVEQHNIAYDGSPVLEGRGAVVFIGSGEYVHSDLDMEDQVIVDKRSVHGAVYVSASGKVYGAGKNGEPRCIYLPKNANGYAGGLHWIAQNRDFVIQCMFHWDGRKIEHSAVLEQAGN